MQLEEQHGDLALVTGLRDLIAKTYAEKWDGIALHGPPWRLGPDEAHLPTYEETHGAIGPEEDIPWDGEAPGAPVEAEEPPAAGGKGKGKGGHQKPSEASTEGS
jgi:hypothetical protein